MATLQATKMQTWRVRSENLYQNEFAQKLYGALDFYVKQTSLAGGLISPELRQRALGSIGNTIEVPVLKRNTTATVGSARTCVAPNNEVDSALVSLTWTTIQDGFTIVPSRYMSNDISEQQHFDANMNDMLRRIATKIDELCLANLATGKTALIADTLNYNFNANTIEAAWNDRMELIGDLNTMMISNGFYGGINLIGNAGTLNLLNKLAEHSIYNDVNKQYEYMDKQLWLTHQLANDSGKYATFYAVPNGQVGILSRVDREAYRGATYNNHEWGMTTLPFMGDLPFGYHFYTEVGDQSTLTGESDITCAGAEHYTFSIDLAFMNAYNSDTASFPSPIIKVDIESGQNGVYLVSNV